MLDNASVAAESAELDQCLALWRRLQDHGEAAGPRWGADWALLAMAAADNTALCLEHYCDTLAGWVEAGAGDSGPLHVTWSGAYATARGAAAAAAAALAA